MNTKRILTIQDISCLGQCSLTVALPIISACGVEAAILPSAVLSTHTGGFTGFTFRDLTDDIPAICSHWKKEGIDFSAIYTGYLGSEKQIDMVRNIFSELLSEGGLKIVDPAMADNGKLYGAFDDKYVEAMKPLIADADIILPNITEAAFLTGSEYKEKYNESYIDTLLEGLNKLGAKTVIMTGVSFDEESTGVLVCENNKKHYYSHKKVSGGFHGTGDIYASAFTGALMRGKTVYDAASIAADYTLACIEATAEDKENHWYGVHFEGQLGKLIDALK